MFGRKLLAWPASSEFAVDSPSIITRYNLYRAAPVNGTPVAGVSSGQALEQMEQLVHREIPRSMRHEWTELALLQLQTRNTAMLVFLLAVVLVFLVLAAQYESWSLPLAVILVVPMCLLCSVAAVLAAHMDVNIFTQVGFVVLIGLATVSISREPPLPEGGDDTVRALANDLRSFLGRDASTAPVIRIEARDRWPIAAGIVLRLYKSSVPVFVDPRWLFMFGPQFAP